ncbi:MAG: N-carbamoylputrescine amidase [Alphaproteobacteria bacterium]|nr:N-carbamoylputrescine amidase [Alphaproteobacteria bacterium]
MRSVSVAVTQMACGKDRGANIARAASLVEEAASQGADIVVLPELFETPYFCMATDASWRDAARATADNPALALLSDLARSLAVVIPVSFYEQDGARRYNSLAVIDADGRMLGLYRKSHIPDFPAYEEAFYFAPGDTGFRVWETAHGKLGCGVCWDQWFPEAARAMALRGAEIIVYPTAIGRPHGASSYAFPNSKPHWQVTMQGHAAANMVIVAAANRVGIERGGEFTTQFYGGSFIADETGAKSAELSEEDEGVAVQSFDLDRIAEFRKGWGVFRTRRPDLYDPLLTTPPPAYLMTR